MKRNLIVCAFALVTACSGDKEQDTDATGGDVLVKQSVSSAAGAMIFYDGQPSVVLSVPPSSLTADIDVTIAKVADVDGALSRVIEIGPESATLTVPAALSISAPPGNPDVVLARVTGNGLERLPRSTFDGASQEVRGEIDRFGRFVVVAKEAASAAVADADAITVSPAPATEASSGGFFATDTAPQPTLAGNWTGQPPHDVFAMRFDDASFEVTRDGTVVRSGSYSLVGELLTLEDTTGATETATIALDGDTLTLQSARSGTVRWQRVAAGGADAATGFFALNETPQEAAEPAAPQPAAKPAAVAKSAPKKPAANAAPASAASDASAGSEPAQPLKKKNIFERMGSGIANAGRSVVRGVQGIGGGGKNEQQKATTVSGELAAAQQTMNEQFATAQQVVNDVTAVPGQLASTGMCTLLAPLATPIVGKDQQTPRELPDNGCEIRGKHGGAVGVTMSTTGAADIARYQRSGQCAAAVKVGDEACLMQLGLTRAKLMFRKGVNVGTVDVETVGGADAMLVTTQIAQLVAAQL